MEGDEPAAAWTDWDEGLEDDPDRYMGGFIRGSIPGSFRGWDGGDMEAGAYTRPLFSSTGAVSDTKCTLSTP
jgi:hypothetical protein